MKGFFFILLLAGAVFTGVAQDHDEVLLLLQKDQILATDPNTLVVGSAIPLPQKNPTVVIPTPGGKFAFVLYENSTEVTVLDVENLQLAESIDFGYSAKSIHFSANGDLAAVAEQNSNRINVYDHRRAQFSGPREILLPSSESLTLVNRRITRIYAGHDGGVAFIYAKNGELIKRVGLRNKPAAMSIDPDFRTIWTIEQNSGFLVAIDENRGRAAKRLKTAHAPLAPLYHENFVLALSADRKELLVYSTRSRRLTASIPLTSTSVDFAVTEGGLIWSASQTGIEVYELDTGTQIQRENITGVISIVNVVIRSGEGFACF